MKSTLALLTSGLLAFATLASAKPKTDPELLSYIQSSSGPKSIIVSFHGTPVVDIANRYSKSSLDMVPQLLLENAARSQASTLELLKGRKALKASGSSYFQLWFTNQLVIDDADLELVEQLRTLPEVAKIEADLPDAFIPEDERHAGAVSSMLKNDDADPQWGVVDVEAPKVWKDQENTGKGVVVGVIDTGVRSTHNALADGFRSDYGWFDAVNGNSTPYDDFFHGTHVTGTAVGKNGLGVAPDAQWIACKGLAAEKKDNKQSYLLKCMQFMYCPTDTSGLLMDCTKRPKVVVNSWGASGYNTVYHAAIDLWISAGMIGIFSNGNNGPGCGTVGSPGSYKNAIGVGNTDQSNKVATDSSRGPASTGDLKPEISAPGTLITSAGNEADDQLMMASGTSMAAPHVAGVAALWAQSNPDMTQDDFRKIATSKAVQTESIGATCGEKADNTFPNNHVGYGKITAMANY